MRRTVTQSLPWCRRLHQTPLRKLTTQRIPSAPSSQALSDIDNFRQKAFLAEKPYHLRIDDLKSSLGVPALQKWFTHDEHGSSFSTHMAEHLPWPFPYELLSLPTEGQQPVFAFRDWLMQRPDPTAQMLAGILQAGIPEDASNSFFQLHAPLKLLANALEFNKERQAQDLQPILLYIAQSSLSDLPTELQQDLPTPELVLKAGKGDVYNSSIWLGTEPTYTPLHRDPNPNLFHQLCNRKVVRLLPPAIGDQVFFEIQVQIKQQASSRIRTTEMMEGAERAVLHEAIWANEKLEPELHEAELGPGDALFIPKGWWHSVKSFGSQGHLNGSVNWWFR